MFFFFFVVFAQPHQESMAMFIWFDINVSHCIQKSRELVFFFLLYTFSYTQYQNKLFSHHRDSSYVTAAQICNCDTIVDNIKLWN